MTIKSPVSTSKLNKNRFYRLDVVNSIGVGMNDNISDKHVYLTWGKFLELFEEPQNI